MKTNYEIRYAAHPEDARHYDTQRLRRDFLIETLFVADEVQMVYSMYDRMVVGGAMPVGEELPLEAIDPLRAPYFTARREVGIYNVGGPGKVIVRGFEVRGAGFEVRGAGFEVRGTGCEVRGAGCEVRGAGCEVRGTRFEVRGTGCEDSLAGEQVFELDYKEALYIGRGNREVIFLSDDPARPAKFYFNSATAHCAYPCRKVTKQDAVVAHMGALETSNERNINKMLVNQVLPTCQLQMGMTELATGSVWNTMPAHTHTRRMEAYFYFELPEDQAVCHFMGEPQETRHLWMHTEQAVLSPEWSIHSAAATHNYTFIWGMGGENLDYSDQDFSQIRDLL